MKKTFTKILSVVLCAVMVLGAAPLGGFVGLDLPQLFDLKAEAATRSGTCGTNLNWSLDTETGVLDITGTGTMEDWLNYSSAPWFWYRSNIKTVNIGNSVTTIGESAFYDCDSLTSVTIGNSVTTIGECAFEDCTSLTSVTIPDSVTIIYECAFEDCTSLTSVTIPDSVTYIGEWAFYSCTSLTSVTIPDSVKTIGDWAFYGCELLTSVTIGNSVTTIGSYAFHGCTSLTNIKVASDNKYYSNDSYGVLFNKDKTKLIQYPTGNARTSYTIPDSVTTIGSEAFANCDKLTSINVDSGNKYYSSDSYGVLFNKNKTKLIQYPIGNTRTSYTIPDSVTTIGSEAFANCDSLTSVTIPDSVTRIRGYEFYSCTSLTSVTIPDSVTSIGYYAFSGCASLTSVTIPDSVTTIGNGAFWGCTSLTSVTIPDSVTTIGDYAFCNCERLTSVTIGNSVTTIGKYAFYVCYSLTDVYYTGTEAQWKKIAIDSYNDPLKNATIHYNHAHALNNVIESVDPTCYKTGYKTIGCVCGYGVITEEIPALNHKDTLVKVAAKAPTCTEIGWDAYEYCTACSYTTYAEKGALDHDIVIDKAVDATCTETGLTEGQHCSRCDDVTIKQDVVPALNHKDTLVKVAAKAPTCTEIGWDAYEYCTACTYTTYAEKPALKHDIIIDKAVDATCTETGLTEGQHCSRCDDMTVEQEVVPVKPHSYTAKHDSAKHWEECVCGAKANVQNHTFVGGNVCVCGFKKTVDSTVKIKNNSGSKTINYGETLKLMSTVTDKPANAKIYWYIDGELKGEGEIFEVKFESGTKIITVKLVDANGVVYQNANGEEISESENVTVKAGFFQKLISFFKNLFRMNRIVVQ